MLEGVLSMQNLISDPVSMTSCRQEAYLLRLRRQFPFVYVKTLTRTAFGRSVYALQFGSGSRKLLITAGHHANETITSDAVWQWLFTFCNALLDGRTVCGAEARELYHNAMVYLVPLVNPDGADLAAGVCAPGSPEYRAAADIAAQYPDIPFPSGWKANIRGIDLNLQYPAGWSTAREIKFAAGYTRPGPRDYVGPAPLTAPESLAMYSFTRALDPQLTLSYHTQGRVIYWQYDGYDVPGSKAIAERFAAVSGYDVAKTPYAAGHAGYKDWFIQDFRRPGFTIEAGSGENPLPLSQFPDIWSDNLGILLGGMAAVL